MSEMKAGASHDLTRSTVCYSIVAVRDLVVLAAYNIHEDF